MTDAYLGHGYPATGAPSAGRNRRSRSANEPSAKPIDGGAGRRYASNMSSEYWSNRSAIVTGAARGQGAAEALRLAQAGARVYAVDVIAQDDTTWNELKELAGANAGQLTPMTLDISKEEDWDQLAALVRVGPERMSGLVNNAGITLRKTATRTEPAEWDRVLGVNLRGAYLGIRAIAPLMTDGGSIINVSSAAGMTGSFAAAYSTSKWGLRGLTKAAAMELAHREIRVNTICPGLIDTPMTKTAHSSLNEQQAIAYYEAVRKNTPFSRGATPDEVAATVMFLLGPDSSFITGVDLAVDGGVLAGGLMMNAGVQAGLLEQRD